MRSIAASLFLIATFAFGTAAYAEDASINAGQSEIIVAALDIHDAQIMDGDRTIQKSVIIGRVLDGQAGVASDAGEYSPMLMANYCHRRSCVTVACPRCGGLRPSANNPNVLQGHCKKGGTVYHCSVRR